MNREKRELVGNFKNNGDTWCTKPEEVNAYNFRSTAHVVFIPYGIYNIKNNNGFVVGDISYNTAEFAVNAIVKYWENETILKYISTTRMETSLKVKAVLDETVYEKGIKISDKKMKRLI